MDNSRPELVCSAKRKLDGFIAESKFWCIKREDDFFYSTPIVCRLVNSHNFKGLPLAETKEGTVYKIVLGQTIHCLEAYLILVFRKQIEQESTTGESNKNSSEQDYKNLGEKTLSIILKAIRKLGNRFWGNNIVWQAEKPNRPYIVSSVLPQVMQELRIEFEKMPDCSKARFVFSCLGQSCTFAELTRILKDFKTNQISNLIVHYALDFKTPNHALFFEKANLVKFFNVMITKQKELSMNLKQSASPTSEYYVCFLRGIGNFVYNLRWMECQMENFTCIEAKFYSEAFKYMHIMKKNEVYFKHQEICDKLFDPRDFLVHMLKKQKNSHLKLRLQELENVQEAVDKFCPRKSPVKKARFETILLVNGEYFKQISTPDVQKDIEDLMDRLFKPKEIKDCLVKIPTSSLGEFLKINFTPFISTIRTFIKARLEKQLFEEQTLKTQTVKMEDHTKECLSEEDSTNGVLLRDEEFAYVFTPDSYVNCIAAEAVLALGMYGNVYWSKQGYGEFKKGQARERKLYPDWLIKGMQMEKKHFNKNISEQNLNDFVFKKCKILEDGTISCQIQGCKISPLIRNVIDSLKDKAVLEGLILLEAHVEAKDEINVCEQLQSVSNLIFQAILDVACLQMCKRTRKFQAKCSNSIKIQQLRRHASLEKTIVMSVQNVLEQISNGEFSTFSYVSWLLGIAKYILKEKFKDLTLQIQRLLAAISVLEGKLLVIPRSVTSEDFVAVVPLLQPEESENLTEVQINMLVSEVFVFLPGSRSHFSENTIEWSQQLDGISYLLNKTTVPHDLY